MTAAVRALTASMLAVLMVGAITIGVPAPASAALGAMGVSFSGPGAARSGKTVAVSLQLKNTTVYEGMTPDLVREFGIKATGVSFNAHARGVKICKARIRRDGFETRCPSRSRVGSGRVRAILGTPGAATDLFGPLSQVDGRFKLYNYRRLAGQSARMLAVIETRRPFGGIAISMTLAVDRHGAVTVKVPTLASLPKALAKAYPKSTKIVLTSMKVTIKPRASASGRSFLWRTRSSALGVRVQTSSPSGPLRPLQTRGSESAQSHRSQSTESAASNQSSKYQLVTSADTTRPRAEPGAANPFATKIIPDLHQLVSGENWRLSKNV